MTTPPVAEPPSGSMTAYDLADALVELLREYSSLVTVFGDEDDYEVEIDNAAVLLFEARIREALRMGGIRP